MIKQIFMNYKTSRDLLLDTKALTEQQAEEILDMWELKPRSYYDFLKNENASKALLVYGGPLTDAPHHQFNPTKICVPSDAVAHKFFALGDENLITQFITLLGRLSVKENFGECVYAWPYLTKEFMSVITMFQLFWLIGDWRYVFNFEDDTHGDLFDSIYRRLPYSLTKDVFVANSFNIMGWLKYARRYSPQEFNKHMLMANHCLAIGSDAEAVARKFYITYRLDIIKELNDLDMRMSHKGMPFAN